MMLVDIASFLKQHGISMRVAFEAGTWVVTTWQPSESETHRRAIGRTLQDAVAAAIATWKN